MLLLFVLLCIVICVLVVGMIDYLLNFDKRVKAHVLIACAYQGERRLKWKWHIERERRRTERVALCLSELKRDGTK